MADSEEISPSGDGKPSPNPNPNSPSSSPVTVSPQQTPTASRKSERKRKIREFPDMSHPRKIPTIWSESDEIALLKAAKEFRERTGAEPKGPAMKEFFESLKGLIGEHWDQDKVYYKMKRLKSKFLIFGPANGPHEKAMYELSSQVWRDSQADGKPRADGVKDENEIHEENEDANANEPIGKETEVHNTDDELDNHPLLRDALSDYSGVTLDKGLKQMDPSRAKELEMKWKKQLEADMRLQMKKHELIKEVYALLIDGVKGQVA